MKPKFIWAISLTTLLICNARAQYASTNMVGIKAGAALTKMKSLSSILVSEDYYSNYTFTDHLKCSPTAALYHIG